MAWHNNAPVMGEADVIQGYINDLHNRYVWRVNELATLEGAGIERVNPDLMLKHRTNLAGEGRILDTLRALMQEYK